MFTTLVDFYATTLIKVHQTTARDTHMPHLVVVATPMRRLPADTVGSMVGVSVVGVLSGGCATEEVGGKLVAGCMFEGAGVGAGDGARVGDAVGGSNKAAMVDSIHS